MKMYETPELTILGSIEEMTLVGGFVKPKDVTHGKPNSAFPS